MNRISHFWIEDCTTRYSPTGLCHVRLGSSVANPRIRQPITRSAQRYAAVERLAEIVTARRQLSDDKVAAENASRLFEDVALRRLYRGRIARLAAEIALLDKRLAGIVAGDTMLARRYALLVLVRCWPSHSSPCCRNSDRYSADRSQRSLALKSTRFARHKSA
jgi:hypothetical protein